jgi:hypothetical protein
MSRIVPLDELDGRIPRAGKISAGYTDVKMTNGKAVTFPVKSRTLVFRGPDCKQLEAAAAIVGGDVSASPNPRAEGMWRLVSRATAVDVMIADELRDRPGRYEFWGKQGKLRDCDGRNCRFLIDVQSGERQENVPCFCAAHGLSTEAPDACRITTRLNVIIPAFVDIPGMGVWQLESRGRSTFSDLKGLFGLCRALGLPGVFGLPVALRIEIVRRRSPQTGEGWEFPVFRFSPRISYGEALNRIRAFQAAVGPAHLPPPDDTASPLGAALTPDREVLSNGASLEDLPTDQRHNGPDAPEPSVARARPMPLHAFRALAQKAVMVLGIIDPVPGKTWLLQHYGTANPAQLSDEQYEDAIRRLREIVNGSGTAKRNVGPAPLAELQPAARLPLVTPGAIAELDAAFEHLGYTPDERPSRIRAFTCGRTDRLAEMTAYEIQALLDELQPDRNGSG